MEILLRTLGVTAVSFLFGVLTLGYVCYGTCYIESAHSKPNWEVAHTAVFGISGVFAVLIGGLTLILLLS